MKLYLDWYILLIFVVTPYSKNGESQCCIISVAANFLSSSSVGNMNMPEMG